jgi:single-strand DNA-binding protein
MPLPTIIIVGNLTQDPELRFTTTGKAVASLRVACSERKKDPAGQWVDGDKVYLNVNVWNDTAENTTKTVSKGDTVVITGKFKQRSYTAKDGTEKTVFEVEADSVGAELRRKAFTPQGEIMRDKPGATQSDNNPWTLDTF